MDRQRKGDDVSNEQDIDVVAERLIASIREVQALALEALTTDGEHHKQWYLERILETLGLDLEQLQPNGYEWEPGIPP